MSNFIPVCEPFLDGREREYVEKTIRDGWISSSGEYINEFEKKFAQYMGVKNAITTNNGTTALHLALAALKIGPGDEVIIPDFTMIATAFSVCYTGAKPVFVDADLLTWNMDVSKIEEKVTAKTKAIMCVHIYGHPCDMESLKSIAKKHNLFLIEDAAEVHGATFNSEKCGTIGEVGCFSLFANKIITTGEGGMVITNDDHLAERCRYLKNLSFPLRGPREYIHEEIGFNYRMSNVIAAIGAAQVEKMDFYIQKRKEVEKIYQEKLKNVPGILFQKKISGSDPICWMVSITVDEKKYGRSRNELMDILKENGIESRKFFYPMHRQPALKNFGCDINGSYPNSIQLSETGLYLPSATNLAEEKIDRVSCVIQKHQK